MKEWSNRPINSIMISSSQKSKLNIFLKASKCSKWFKSWNNM